MALGTATLLTPSVTALNATATTASFTPSANQTIYAAGGVRRATPGATTQPTISDSTGTLTWTAINEATLSGAAANLRLRVWSTTVGASPAAMTVSIAAATSGSERHTVTVIGLTAASTDNTNNVVGTNGTGDPSIVLPSTQSSTSTTIGFCLTEATNAITQPSGYTELEDISLGGTIRVETVALAGTTGTTLTWSSNNTDAVAVAIEVKLATYSATGTATSPKTTASATAAQAFSATGAATSPKTTASGAAASAAVAVADLGGADWFQPWPKQAKPKPRPETVVREPKPPKKRTVRPYRPEPLPVFTAVGHCVGPVARASGVARWEDAPATVLRKRQLRDDLDLLAMLEAA